MVVASLGASRNRPSIGEPRHEDRGRPLRRHRLVHCPRDHHPGVSVATWRTVQAGDVRVRVVTYSPGYLADHWCSRGHILFVLEGELLTEIHGGAVHTLTGGTPTRSLTTSRLTGPRRRPARLFIVD
ncbi:MAG: DHCW motif cupin fold protein [Holophagales bacterium]|nr:DHCW motif cupin fold protein [Holophagales bacterium]